MEIKELNISNYKSIKEISIKNPNPFTVFVGPNAAGKSNIFDALEFYTSYSKSLSRETMRLFGEINHFGITKTDVDLSRHHFELLFKNLKSNVGIELRDRSIAAEHSNFFNRDIIKNFFSQGNNDKISSVAEPKEEYLPYWKNKFYLQFYNNFSRVFVGNKKVEKFEYKDDNRLSLACNNLEQVLKRVLANGNKKTEITEWLKLLIPGFKNIEIETQELSGSDNLVVYEKAIKKPLSTNIISDGTYNLIAILTALHQSDEPQFLCIEEPENGLNPKVVRELVNICRQQCEEKGHFIWLNTHSQSIVSELNPKEIILVDKIDGETKIKQIQDMDLHGLKMDEALLTNTIGGGIPW